MRRAALALIFMGAAANASVPTEPIGTVCFNDGECVSLPASIEFATREECEAAIPLLYNAFVMWLIRQGLANSIRTAEVECVPKGVDS